jgi:hypothetical protein
MLPPRLSNRGSQLLPTHVVEVGYVAAPGFSSSFPARIDAAMSFDSS